MPIVQCPECGDDVQVRPGKVATCGACGTRLRPKSAAPTVVPADEDAVDDNVPARPRRRRRSGGRLPWACPHCGSDNIQNGPWPWYLGTVGAFLCKAMVCEDCGHEFDLFKPRADLAKRKLHLALAINGVGLVGIIAVLVTLILFIRMSMNG